ncbi:protein mono-ADP-ribosyltransferase PARP9-like isoform X2 [Garra rufa]
MSNKEQGQMQLVSEQAAILGKCAGAFCHAISVKFNCTAILHNVEEAGSFGSDTSGVWHAKKRYSRKLSRTVEISVWKDDLTRHKVEAVVNAANEKLKHGGGLAQALCDAGGPAIQKWSDYYIQQMKRVKTGDAVLGPAGNLPCKHIIHAVGPKLSQNPSKKEIDDAAPLLYNAVKSILLIVAKENIASVAIPALSSGLFNFPRDRCAEIIVKAIQQFHENGRFQDKNFEIRLVNNDEPSVREMERATKAVLDLSGTSASYGGAVQGRNQSMASSSNNSVRFGDVREKAFEKEMKMRKGGAKSQHGTTSFASASKETTANKVPTVVFNSVFTEALREAKAWMLNVLNQSDNMTIKNNHGIYIDQRDHENLFSLQTKFHVRIEEFFRNGKDAITITGNPSDVSCAAIEVESMLCKAKEYFARAKEREMLYSVVRWSCKGVPWIQTPENSAVLEKYYLSGIGNFDFNNHNVNLMSSTLADNSGKRWNLERTCLITPFKSLNNSFYGRTPVSRNDYVGKEETKDFIACGLHILKVDKLENIVLKQLFEKNMQRMKDKPKRLYQRVSAQFCDLICRVGFQKEITPPAEQKYGSGIYFSSTVDGAMKLWKDQEHEQYIYIIQAQVLTGKSKTVSPHSSLPSPLSKDPLDHFDSLSDLQESYVIISGQQALPEYLIICTRSSHV